MIDNFALVLSHALLALVAWRLLSRADLDQEAPGDAAPDAPVSASETQVANAAGIVRLHRA